MVSAVLSGMDEFFRPINFLCIFCMYMFREISFYRYTAGAAVQIFLFGIVAMQLKRRAPKAHTVLELVRHRWGNAANFVIIFHSFVIYLFVLEHIFLGLYNIVLCMEELCVEIRGKEMQHQE